MSFNHTMSQGTTTKTSRKHRSTNKAFRGRKTSSKVHTDMQEKLTKQFSFNVENGSKEVDEEPQSLATIVSEEESAPPQNFRRLKSEDTDDLSSEVSSEASAIRYGVDDRESFTSFLQTVAPKVNKVTIIDEDVDTPVDHISEDILPHLFDPDALPKTDHEPTLHDLYLGSCFTAPLVGLFVVEYFIDTRTSIALGLVTSSYLVAGLEMFQYIPQIMSLRYYKIPDDIDDVSCYLNFYFHALMAYSYSGVLNRVVQVCLVVQQSILISLLWNLRAYTTVQLRQIATNSLIFLSGVFSIDYSLGSLMSLPVTASVFRASVLIMLQVVRWMPQWSTNEKHEHCAVQSVESHAMNFLASCAKVYSALINLEFSTFANYSASLIGSAVMAYQNAIYAKESEAYIERQLYIASKLPAHKETVPFAHRNHSLKFKAPRKESQESFVNTEGFQLSEML